LREENVAVAVPETFAFEDRGNEKEEFVGAGLKEERD